ncbi:MAG TPA: hypothetical protein VMW56_09510 [Candidatus Margulisiibacteriota bacterium]|nr:hypothetical protein [Candidatus Margulisiibacteriota bacterium]
MKTKALLLLGALLPLAGCLLEDTIAITNDGQVTFESTATEADEQKKVEFPAFEKTVTALVDELRQHKWKVELTWKSKERPYRLKLSGSGKLSEVEGLTTLYGLRKSTDKKYQVYFVTPLGGQRRIAVQSAADGPIVVDPAGKPVQEIASPTAKETYTIVLR